MSLEAVLRQRAKTIRQRLMYPPNPIPDTGIDLKRPKIITRIPPEEAHLGPRSIVSVVEQYREYQPSVEIVEVLEYHQRPHLAFHHILQTVSEHYSTPIEDIVGPIRQKNLVLCRRVIAYLSLKLLKLRSVSSIARELKKDHTSILHGQKEMLRILPNNMVLFSSLVSIEEKLRADYHC